MISEIDIDKVDSVFAKHFEGYKKIDDPFQKVAIYSNKGIISYSIIYERAEINYILVIDQRKGIGSKLLEYALEDIKKNKCTVVSLEVEEENTPAINLYLKHGFSKQSIRKNYYKDKDGILMTKEMR